MIAVVDAQQVLAWRRQRVVIVLASILLAMTAAAGLLGWSSHRTILAVYDEATKLLAVNGQPAPANPFTSKPHLALLSNMVIYIPLIGALLAIVLGHFSIADDDASGVGRLVFSRPIDRRQYLAGKLLAAAGVLATILTCCLAISAASLWIVNTNPPSPAELARLATFYALSWLYLMLFAAIGIVAMLVTPHRPLALLTALGAWLVITFVIPQLTSGLRPTASLNPIVDPVSTTQTVFRISSRARPISVVEQYKAISGQILDTSPGDGIGHAIARTTPLVVLFLAIAATSLTLISHHDFSRGAAHD